MADENGRLGDAPPGVNGTRPRPMERPGRGGTAAIDGIASGFRRPRREGSTAGWKTRLYRRPVLRYDGCKTKPATRRPVRPSQLAPGRAYARRRDTALPKTEPVPLPAAGSRRFAPPPGRAAPPRRAANGRRRAQGAGCTATPGRGLCAPPKWRRGRTTKKEECRC